MIDRTAWNAAPHGTAVGGRLRGAVRARVLSLWSRDLVPLRAPHAFVLRVARVATLVVRGIIAHQVKLLAAALTYYTVFSIVPLLVVALWILKALDYLPIIPAALPYLRRACSEEDSAGAGPGDEPLPPEFLRECRRLTADAAYRVGDFARAKTALQHLLDGSEREAEKARAKDWLERVTWAEHQPRAL